MVICSVGVGVGVGDGLGVGEGAFSGFVHEATSNVNAKKNGQNLFHILIHL